MEPGASETGARRVLIWLKGVFRGNQGAMPLPLVAEWLKMFLSSVLLCYTGTVVIYNMYCPISSFNEWRLRWWWLKKVASILGAKSNKKILYIPLIWLAGTHCDHYPTRCSRLQTPHAAVLSRITSDSAHASDDV